MEYLCEVIRNVLPLHLGEVFYVRMISQKRKKNRIKGRLWFRGKSISFLIPLATTQTTTSILG